MKYLKRIIQYFYFKIVFSKNLIFPYSSEISFGSKFYGLNKINKNSFFSGIMEGNSYIGDNCKIYAKIGKYVSIAGNVKIVRGTHPLERFVSTSPIFYSLLKQSGKTYTDKQRFDEILCVDDKCNFGVVINNDVWICDGVTIIGGINIGNGAVVLTGSVVTKDVPPYAIVGGVPAKIIRYRFPEETIKILDEFQWWNQDETWLKSHIEEMENINTFMEMLNR